MSFLDLSCLEDGVPLNKASLAQGRVDFGQHRAARRQVRFSQGVQGLVGGVLRGMQIESVRVEVQKTRHHFSLFMVGVHVIQRGIPIGGIVVFVELAQS